MSIPEEATGPREIPVTVETRDRRALRLQRHDDGTVKLLAGTEPATTFSLVMMEPDRFALRAHDSTEYLSVRDVSAGTSPEFGSSETFQLVRSAEPQFFGFRSVAAGRHLSAPAGAGSELVVNADGLGETEMFTFVPAPVVEPGEYHSCCCGPGSGAQPGILWDEQTHFRIVELAVHLLGHMQNPTPEATFVYNVWQAGYANHIREGLKGADEWDDWKPTHPLWFMFYYHFFNHDTGHSFAWPQSWYPQHAVSKGEETFNSSVQRYRQDPDKKQACIDLGLSLHYLTDLCQPMHAANFINMPPINDWRHAGYEKYAEDYVVKRNFFRQPHGYPALERWEVEDTNPTPAGWLRAVSVQSLQTWKDGLSAETEKKVIVRPGPFGPVYVFLNEWGSEADPSLMRSLWLAPRNTARYLCIWANRVMR